MKCLKVLLVLFFAINMAACGAHRRITTIRSFEVMPVPNVDIEPIKEKLYLEISEEVQDVFIDRNPELKTLEINGWRASLSNGFMSAFEEFDIVEEKGDAQRILRIYRATPSRTLVDMDSAQVAYPSLRFGTTYDKVTTVIVGAQITYKARLLDAEGGILKRSASTVTSKNVATRRSETESILQSSIETMYETIAKDLF